MPQQFGSGTQRLSSCLRAAAFAITSLAITSLTVAHAAAEDAVVEALIQRGIELRREGADKEALAIFLGAEKQDPTSVRVLLHIVTAAQAAGKWLVAHSYMNKVSELKEAPYYQRHAEAIDVVRRAVLARVGDFQVQGKPEGASVLLNGQSVGTLPMNEPIPVEAGAYVMEVQKPGFYPLRRNVTINGGVMTREPVELNETRQPPTSGVRRGAANQLGVNGEAERAWWQEREVGWGLLGIGAASGVVSTIAFVSREKSVDRWNGNQCVPDDGTTRQFNCGALREDAESAESLGVFTGLLGAVMAGAGVVHLLALDGGEAGAMSVQASGTPMLTGCDAGFLSLSCKGSF